MNIILFHFSIKFCLGNLIIFFNMPSGYVVCNAIHFLEYIPHDEEVKTSLTLLV